MINKKIFLSHSFNDRKIAERIIDKLLVETIKINKSEIFFTSKRETGIRSSKVWREQIREQLLNCNLFIALITPSYHQSQMCQAELGAAWVNGKTIYCLYLPPITTNNFSVVIADRQADNLRNKEEVKSFIEQITDDLNTKYNRKLNISNLDDGLKKFYKSLRAYLRKNASNLGIEYNENSKEKLDNHQILIPEIDMESIKKNAKSEYADDFSMQEYTINEQVDSYAELEKILNNNSHRSELKVIIEKAFREWDKNYSMIVYTIKEQLDSLDRLG
ncbi:toll/interleukin-1 receptor domain-containing protein [Aurantibacter sp.]|uniref:toll/interleukin-1 receptor domain-containing protein n=1 Tax=Aurantibacter sp. TaxID=2807103 RepID=UPI003264CC89